MTRSRLVSGRYGRWQRTVVVALVAMLVVVSAGSPAVAATSTADTDVTFVESAVTTDTTWTPADGPYRIIQDIEVEPGATLTVERGTTIEVAEDITVTVSGSLRTNGTAASPVAITRSDGAAADRRWGSLRYNGTDRSSLVLRHTTLAGGTAGITAVSGDGTIEVVDATLRDFTTAGIEVAGTTTVGAAVGATTTAPPITVRRSTFRNIGGHAIRATPSTGTTDQVSLTAAPDAISENAEHTLSLRPGVAVSFDSIDIAYSSDGSVASVGGDDIDRIGIDRDGDDDIERSLAGSVASVSSTDARLRISFSESVDLPSHGRLIVEYGDAVNPTTRGIYPVGVQLRADGIAQLSSGVNAPFVVGDVTSPYAGFEAPFFLGDTTSPYPGVELGAGLLESAVDQPPTRVFGLTVVDSTFSGIDGTGVFVGADRAGAIRAVQNRMRDINGSGVSVRADRTWTDFRGNEITAAADGIRVTTSGAATVTATGNRIRDARTGIRVRQSETVARGDITLQRNTLTNNTDHGVGIRTRSVDVTPVVTNNTARGNGGDGIHVSGWVLRDGAFSHNEVLGNADAGVSIRTNIVTRNLTIGDNTVADNGAHGLELRSDFLVYGTDLSGNRLANNAGAGLVVSSPVTHSANLSVANNVVAANTYGVVLRGVLDTTVRDNDIVFNTNRFADPVRLPDVEPGTGSHVASGDAGVVLNLEDDAATAVAKRLPGYFESRPNGDEIVDRLVSNPAVDGGADAIRIGDGSVVVLRTDESSYTRADEAGALTIGSVSGGVPTGVGVPKPESDNGSYRFTGNDIYGHSRGLTVDIAPLITSNTTALVLAESTRTVHAESNYWGSRHGPYHPSILPAGEGNSVVTTHGWVDFVPFRDTPVGPEYTRPTATIDAPTGAPPGGDVQASGSRSTTAQGSIARYRFRIGGTAQPDRDRPTYTFEMPDQRVEVGLVVEDDLGIESTVTTVTVDPGTPTPSTPTATTATTPESTPPTGSESTLLGSLGSIWGLLGGICYLVALVFGTYGVVLTVTNRSPPVEGVRIQALAGLGISIWIVAGWLGSSRLLTVGLAAAGAWIGLTGAAYVVVTRGLLDDIGQ